MEIIVSEKFNGNKAAFAKALGLPPTMMSTYLGKRRSVPSAELAAKIVLATDVDAKWLLTGKSATKSHIETIGNYSPVSMNGNVSIGADALMSEKIKALEALLAEKERIIQIYEKMTNNP